MKHTILKLWAFTKNRRQTLLKALAFSFVRSAMGVTQLLALMATVSVLLGGLTVKQGIIRVAVYTVICIAGSFATSYFEQIHSLESGMYSTADCRTEVARRMRRVPLGYFRRSSSEKLIATLTSTLGSVEMASTMSMVGIVSGLFNAAAMWIFMMIYDWRMGLIMGAGIIAYLLIVSMQMRISRTHAPVRQAAQTELATASLTFLQGIQVTKAFCPERGDARLDAAIDESRDANINLTTISMPSQVAAHVCIAVFESLLLLATVYFTFTTGEFGPEKAIVLLIFSAIAYAALNQAGSMLSMIGMLESGLDELEDIQQVEELEITRPESAPAGEEIQVEHLHFSYGDHEVLHDITTGFKPHTLTAVIGPSGSGKTTLCLLLARFQDPQQGRITLGGADIRSIPYEQLMEKISIVFQNVYLFEDTIAANIRFGKPEATMEEVRKAAKAARCDDFIMSLPDGYDTMVLEGGSNLSGGEKQRISIARAMLKDSPIIILDEATSALDAENERAFFDAVDELTRDKTVIMIAHRLSTVQRADRIIAVKDGRIVQEGSPAELRAQPGLYADFLHSRESASGWTLEN